MRAGRAVRGILAAAGLALAVPAIAQQMTSDSYSFLKAVRDRDGNKVQSYFDKPAGGTIAQARDYNTGESALHIVTRRRDLTYLQFMLGKGAPIDGKDNQGMTALAIAAQIGWTEGAQQLVDVGARVDLPDDHGETPLILATQSRDLAMVRLLLAAGADPRITDNAAGMSALDYAKRDPRAAQVLVLIEQVKPKARRAIAGPSITGRPQPE